MLRKKVSHKLWDYILEWVAEIIQRTYGSAGCLHYSTSIEEAIDATTDISEYLDFSFYD